MIVVDGNIFDLPDDVSQTNFEDLDNEEQFATLLSINPEDIEEIKVLKDNAAGAIWAWFGSAWTLRVLSSGYNAFYGIIACSVFYKDVYWHSLL